MKCVINLSVAWKVILPVGETERGSEGPLTLATFIRPDFDPVTCHLPEDHRNLPTFCRSEQFIQVFREWASIPRCICFFCLISGQLGIAGFCHEKGISLIANFVPPLEFFFKINLFIYFWLCWVFVAAHRLPLVAASGGYSSLRCAGFSLWWLLLLCSTGSKCVAFSSCGSRAPERRLSSCGAWA